MPNSSPIAFHEKPSAAEGYRSLQTVGYGIAFSDYNLLCFLTESDYAQSRICPDVDSLAVRVAVRLVGENMTDLTPQLLLAVPCPTCGVDAGKHCLLHTGELSPDPHIDRKLDATEAIETEKIPNQG
jgi:hypothetical protein